MSRSVGVAELKANLSAWLRRVKRGSSVTVMQRDTPIARLIPVDDAPRMLRFRPARGRLADLKLPPPLETRSEIVDLLLEERGER